MAATKLEKTVKLYKKILGNIKGKTAFIVLDIRQKQAFYSLAPLSKAMDELGYDINIHVINKKSESIDVLEDVWKCYKDMNKGREKEVEEKFKNGVTNSKVVILEELK